MTKLSLFLLWHRKMYQKGTNEIQTEPSDIVTFNNLLAEKSKEMIIQDNSESEDDDDQSYSPPLQLQINKENTPDYLGDDEQQMIKTPPSSTSKRITSNSRDSKGKWQSSDKVNYVFIIIIVIINY